MISGIPVQANIQEYAATSMNLATRNEIFSAMVVYGFLNYEKGHMNPLWFYLAARDYYRIEQIKHTKNSFSLVILLIFI
jgi:hypothetical protein